MPKVLQNNSSTPILLTGGCPHHFNALALFLASGYIIEYWVLQVHSSTLAAPFCLQRFYSVKLETLFQLFTFIFGVGQDAILNGIKWFWFELFSLVNFHFDKEFIPQIME